MVASGVAERADEWAVDWFGERQVLHRVAGVPHLREEHHVGAERGRLGHGREARLRAPGDVLLARSQLHERDAERTHAVTLPWAKIGRDLIARGHRDDAGDPPLHDRPDPR